MEVRTYQKEGRKEGRMKKRKGAERLGKEGRKEGRTKKG
jgi:hypothetical protein